MSQIRLYFDFESGPYDVVLTTDDTPPSQLMTLFRDVTPDAADKLTAEFDLVDLTDLEQVKAIRDGLLLKLPRAYSWHWQQYQARQLEAMPRRGALGRFRRSYGDA